MENFKTIERQDFKLRPKSERLKDNFEVYSPPTPKTATSQAKRCMSCGTTFCSWGCPLGNMISYWNKLSSEKQYEEAYKMLSRTSNFPEFTSRICPALCEASCTLGINREPVSIRAIEFNIIETAFEKGWVKPRQPKMRTGKSVAIVGSGPSGLAAADELNAVGHDVTVFERNTQAGGLLRYGIPNFKLEKQIIDRRLNLMEEAGIHFVMNTCIGKDISPETLLKDFDALVLTGGSTIPRDLKVEGRDLEGIHFAVDYLENHTKRIHGVAVDSIIDAEDKVVLVIGGGDTGSDCIGTANRQGAKKVYQVEIMPKPPETRTLDMPWPEYPRLNKVTSSHKEGCEQFWQVSTQSVKGEAGKVSHVILEAIEWESIGGRMVPKTIKGSEFELQVDMILLAMGFVSPENEGMIETLGLALDERGNVKTDKTYHTNRQGVFTAGDMHRGQSLVVRAIKEGRTVASSVDAYLMGDTYIRG